MADYPGSVTIIRSALRLSQLIGSAGDVMYRQLRE